MVDKVLYSRTERKLEPRAFVDIRPVNESHLIIDLLYPYPLLGGKILPVQPIFWGIVQYLFTLV